MKIKFLEFGCCGFGRVPGEEENVDLCRMIIWELLFYYLKITSLSFSYAIICHLSSQKYFHNLTFFSLLSLLPPPPTVVYPLDLIYLIIGGILTASLDSMSSSLHLHLRRSESCFSNQNQIIMTLLMLKSSKTFYLT